MPFGTRFGNFPGLQELSVQLCLYFFCDFVFVELCICICIWSWWECTFGEIVTSYLSRREIQTPLSIRCHQAWPSHVTESSTAITNTKIQNKEIKTFSDNTNTKIQNKEIKTCSDNTNTEIKKRNRDLCHHDLQGNVSETSRLLFRFNLCWWCCCLGEKRLCFKTIISIPVPSSFF